MKTMLKYILLLMICNGCKAQNNIKNTTKMKTFDIATFEKNKNHLNEYNFITNDSTQIEQGKWHSGYEETVKPKNYYIYTYNKYYNNGKLKLTGEFFPNDFEKGVWKEYDEQGNLLKETDYDKPYKFTWEDILAFIKKREIDMNAYGFEVTRGQNKKGTTWAITYNKSEEKMLLGIIVIDGITGKILIETEREYPSEE